MNDTHNGFAAMMRRWAYSACAITLYQWSEDAAIFSFIRNFIEKKKKELRKLTLPRHLIRLSFITYRRPLRHSPLDRRHRHHRRRRRQCRYRRRRRHYRRHWSCYGAESCTICHSMNGLL
jgi:hypothetical protein